MSNFTPAPMSTTSLSLYEVEDNLLALADSDALVSEEQRAQYEDAVRQGLTVAKDKRDAVARYLISLKDQAGLADAEIDRLQVRKARICASIKRLESFVISVIEQQPGRTKLEGNTSTLALQKNPDSVRIDDEAAVPSEYKDRTIAISGAACERLLALIASDEFGHQIRLVGCTVRKSDLKRDLAVKEVPGASIQTGAVRLVVR